MLDKKRLYRNLKPSDNNLMTRYDFIANRFSDSIQAIAEHVDTLAPEIDQAANLLSQSLLSDGKVLICGLGADAATAELFTSYFINRFELERPALPAINLAQGVSTTSSLVAGGAAADYFSRQIKALGRREDTLVCLAHDINHPAILKAVRAAHEQELSVLILASARLTDLLSLLIPTDVSIIISSERASIVYELEIMCIHRLLELVDQALFFNTTGADS